MKLYPIDAGNFKLDGGAMFGVVPKTLWEQTNPADEKNRIEMVSRCLLVEEGDKLILIDTGMGTKQGNSFFRHYSLWGDHSLERSLAKEGFHPDDVTDVFLTHLHFDHCGGAVKKTLSGLLVPAFKNALFWVHKSHWDWAVNPNPREKASFLKENLLPLEESGQLHLYDGVDSGFCKELGFDLLLVDGHTEKMALPMVEYKGRSILFTSDLVPTAGHIPVPYLMGYDVRPLVTMEEKSKVLKNCLENGTLLFLQHDPYNELVTLMNTDKGVRLSLIHI